MIIEALRSAIVLVWSDYEIPKVIREFWLKLVDGPTMFEILKSWYGLNQGNPMNLLMVMVRKYDKSRPFNDFKSLFQGCENFKNSYLSI